MPLKGIKQNKLGLNWKAADLAPVKRPEDLKSVGRRSRGRIPRGRAEQAWDDAKDRVRTVQKDGERYVRKNPTKAVFTALGIGFVLGLIFRR